MKCASLDTHNGDDESLEGGSMICFMCMVECNMMGQTMAFDNCFNCTSLLFGG